MPENLKFWKRLSPFTKAAFTRAFKTMAQVALAILMTHDRVSGVDWSNLLDVSVMSGLMSILTSVSTGVPESPLQIQEGQASESAEATAARDEEAT